MKNGCRFNVSGSFANIKYAYKMYPNMINFDSALEIDVNPQLIHAETLRDDYYSACEWINSFGIQYKATRFGQYEKDFEKLSQGRSGDELADDDVLKQFQSYLNTRLEAVQLIRLHKTFEALDSDDFVSKLRRVCFGRVFRYASSKDYSRDFAFELSIASRFIMAGYEVDIDQVSDVVAYVDGTTLYLECKRITSEKQILKRVKEANKQISKRLKSNVSKKTKGIIAIDLTDVINPKGKNPVVENLDVFKQINRRLVNTYINEHEELLHVQRHKRCIGGLFELTLQGVVHTNEKSTLVNSRAASIMSYDDLGDGSHFVDTFWSRLGDQDI